MMLKVKGDIATGKTSLLTRLKGGEFSDTQKAHGAGPVEVELPVSMLLSLLL